MLKSKVNGLTRENEDILKHSGKAIVPLQLMNLKGYESR